MGQIKPEIYKKYNRNHPRIFVETGTYYGGIPQLIMREKSIDAFDKMYTIELSSDACKIAAHRYSLFEKYNLDLTKFDEHTTDKDETFDKRKEFFDGRLNLIEGDSTKKLKGILEEINQPVCFWLDAHAGSKKGYARGAVDCPLIQELTVIRHHGIKEHFIAIDDAHLFGQVQRAAGEIVCDYSNVPRELVESLIKQINSDYKIEYISPYGQLMLVAYIEEVETIPSSGWWSE